MQRNLGYLLPALTVLIICLCTGFAYSGSQSSSNYTMESHVICETGGEGSSLNYVLRHALGQSSPISASSSSAYHLYAGYQHPSQVPPEPNISVSPTSHNFGSIDVGSTSMQNFVVTNEGDGDIVITNLFITGTDVSQFSIENDDCSGQTLAPSVAGSVDVIFSPQSDGAKSANLSIPSNDPDTPVLDVPLSGTGATVTPSTGGGGGGGGNCFIATAAYGSPMADDVLALQEFRDSILLKTSAGKSFVRFYYKVSPPLANYIEGCESLKTAVRIGLMPLVAISYFALHFGPVVTLALLMVLLATPIFLVSFCQRKARGYRANS